MHRAIIFNGVWTFAIALSVFFLQGKQARREMDEQMFREQTTTNLVTDDFALTGTGAIAIGGSP